MSKKTPALILLSKVLDIVGSPLTYISALWLKLVIRIGTLDMKFSERIFMSVGLLPVRDHYYQPLINPRKHLKRPLHQERVLPGVNLDIEAQLKLLKSFQFTEELYNIPTSRTNDPLDYHYSMSGFLSGDAEYLYSIVRHFKPKRIIEIGCGTSTLIMRKARIDNLTADHDYKCEHTCIEPYENSWLEKSDCTVLRQKVEDVPIEKFLTLDSGDILFIDSSHIIRPQGDVLFEFQNIIPTLKSGVLIHIHDIFTPRDYLGKWVYDQHLLWNEQYILESFLAFNADFHVIGSLNYLKHNYFEALAAKCPVLAKQPDREPGSFWLQRK